MIYRLRKVAEPWNLKLKISRGYKRYIKILAKIEEPEVDVYVRKNVPPYVSQPYVSELQNSKLWTFTWDFSFFLIFPKIGILIKSHELLAVYKFYSDWNKGRGCKLVMSQNKYFIVHISSSISRRVLKFET